MRLRTFAPVPTDQALAPFDPDSGQHCGGRAKPRYPLYMTAVAAIRWNPDSNTCYERLVARGKPPTVTLGAVMHKLASLLNILLRKNRMWQAEPPTPVGGRRMSSRNASHPRNATSAETTSLDRPWGTLLSDDELDNQYGS